MSACLVDGCPLLATNDRRYRITRGSFLQFSLGLVQNKAGQFVQPSADSFQAAADRADWGNAQDFYLVMTDADGESSYPVTATTFILMYKKPKDVQRTKAALDFFKWALEEGQGQAQELDYVPLPLSLVSRIQLYWKANVSTGM